MGTGETRYLTLGGGAPWGFRLQGGGAQPLTVSKVRRKGKANMNDLREGDIVMSINGVPVSGKTHELAMEFVDQASNELMLEIFRASGKKPQVHVEAPADSHGLKHVVKDIRHEKTGPSMDPQGDLRHMKNVSHPPAPQPKFQPVVLAQAQTRPTPPAPKVNAASTSYSFGDDNSRTHVNASGYEQVSGDGQSYVRQQQVTSVTTGKWGSGQQQPPPPPMFKPTKFQPGGQPQVNVTAMFSDRGKENISPVQNQWQQQQPQKQIPTFSVKDNRSLQEQKQPRADYAESHHPYHPPSLDEIQHGQFHPSYDPSFGPQWKKEDRDLDVEVTTDTDVHHDGKLHVFGPQVQISLTPPDSLAVSAVEPYEDLMSPDSDLLDKKKMFSDSAFYDDPEANFPTIGDQMKLCKIIALSLTSEANKKARGARMFAKRKKFSSKWAHVGGSSSGGDVALVTDLDSELYEEDGGVRPLFAFRIPSVAVQQGIPDPPKMTLTKEEFEKVRLKADKNEHRSVSPNTCFSIVADLHSQKGRGSRMFEKRVRKSEKWVVDETNVPLTPTTAPSKQKLEDILRVPPKPGKSPWDAALDNPYGTVGDAFSQIDNLDKMKAKGGYLNKHPQGAMHVDRSNLTADNQPHLLDGPKFNMTAKGWMAQDDTDLGNNSIEAEQYVEEAPAQPYPEPPPVAPKPKHRDFNPKIRGFQGSPTPMEQDPSMWSSQTSAASHDSELMNYGGYPGGGHSYSPHGFNHGYQQQPIALPGSDL